MLKTILSVSGKPGLYKMISQGKNLLIIESLADKKRLPVYAKDKVISLGDIAIYTIDAEVPLHEVLEAVKTKENAQKIVLDASKATTDELRAYMGEVLPSFDKERVYPSDIKRLINWYNLLVQAEITDFAPKQEEQEEVEKDEAETKDEAKPATKTTKAATPKSTAVTAKNVTSKQPAGKTTQRTRQK